MPAAETWSRCEGWLQERWTGVYSNQQGVLIVPNFGRTACFVEVTDIPDGLTRVNIHAPVVRNVRATPAFFQYMAMFGTVWQFGALTTYEEDGTHVEVDYSLLGESLTSSILNFYVERIAHTANGLIETIQNSFGGTTIY